MSYRERPAPAWIAAPVACVWRTVADGTGSVLPDGCADLVHIEGHGAFLAGPDTAPFAAHGLAGAVTGVRLRPGHAAAAVGVPASELCDRRVPLAELWGRAGRELAERLDAAPDAAAREDLLLRALARRARPADPVALGAVALLARAPDRRIAAVAAELGVGERRLLRRVHEAVGYGPKTLARILRFQRLLGLAEAGAGSLAELALAAGYADQPHMTAEVGRLAGAVPTAVLGTAAPRGDGTLGVRFLQDAAGRAA